MKSCLELLQPKLAATLCQKLPELGALALEVLPSGAEAMSVVKLSANCSMVAKTIAPQAAEEEVAQIRRINSVLPGTCPRILHVERESGLYVTEFLPGETLEQKLRRHVCGFGAQLVEEILGPSLLILRTLHNVSRRPYGSTYHRIIVEKRLAEILNCHATTKNLRDQSPLDIERFYLTAGHEPLARAGARHLSEALSRLVDVYLANLPNSESLIHGDPHLGNIICQGDSIKFIDPRVTWDQVKNGAEGHFDPLYDIACLAHSAIANVILETFDELFEQHEKRQKLIDCALDVLGMYLQREATTGEHVRFVVYLICCLSGNLKYSKWAPNKITFWLTLNMIDRLQRGIPTMTQQPGALAR